MTTLCHCKDEICLPEICVSVVLWPKQDKEGKLCACMCVVYVTSWCVIFVLSDVKYQHMCFMNYS